jgi:hypothetical protein
MLAAEVESEVGFEYPLLPCARASPDKTANKQRITAAEAVTFLCGDSLSGFRSSISKQGRNITNAISYLDSRCRIIDANDCWQVAEGNLRPLTFDS